MNIQGCVSEPPIGSNQRRKKMVFVASPLNMQHQGERAKTFWLGIRIMCQREAIFTCLSADCCFRELAL